MVEEDVLLRGILSKESAETWAKSKKYKGKIVPDDLNLGKYMIVKEGTIVEEKKPGICNAAIEFDKDEGDPALTFRCSLLAGHEGSHQEVGQGGSDIDDKVKFDFILTWKKAVEEVK